ncbi:cell division protein SepF [Aphanothece sacrum]|uniref:Cell division protein SepF n=1 Tax=Aphanothece sacrum FPU1 TaxID=1920663 RepID=A0A401IEG5_APHSA|nr:cell division protein SepF [Aphanothece sacrum]GBF79634.1 cell division protein SepF [Aphanothece sacrum FPU1]GBF87094.1 cell division protein SepF [Aphanothece sacrum FPU3]
MIFKKLKDWANIDEPIDDEDDSNESYEEIYGNLEPDNQVQDTSAEDEQRNWRKQDRLNNLTPQSNMRTSRSNNVLDNVIGMPGITNSIAEVVVVEPHSFDEMPEVIQTLRERKSVVLNLNSMDPEEAQRAVDFVAGGTYAIDGHQERIGESIFLFTPSCVKVSTLSGTMHDVPDVNPIMPRSSSPISSWGADVNRLVQ